jgi:hypothetical protein
MRYIALALLLTACGGSIGISGGSGGSSGAGGTVVVVDPLPSDPDLLNQLSALSTYIDESGKPIYRDLIDKCDAVAAIPPISETLVNDCAMLSDMYFELCSAQTVIRTVTGTTSGYILQSIIDQVTNDINDFNIQVLNVGADLYGN